MFIVALIMYITQMSRMTTMNHHWTGQWQIYPGEQAVLMSHSI